jgi:hypothetical protein
LFKVSIQKDRLSFIKISSLLQFVLVSILYYFMQQLFSLFLTNPSPSLFTNPFLALHSSLFCYF